MFYFFFLYSLFLPICLSKQVVVFFYFIIPSSMFFNVLVRYWYSKSVMSICFLYLNLLDTPTPSPPPPNLFFLSLYAKSNFCFRQSPYNYAIYILHFLFQYYTPIFVSVISVSLIVLFLLSVVSSCFLCQLFDWTCIQFHIFSSANFMAVSRKSKSGSIHVWT